MRGQTEKSILEPKLQRNLRNATTDAERRLRLRLRGRQLDGCQFRRRPPRQSARKLPNDAERDRFLAEGGFRVLRFWNNDVLPQTQAVADGIHRHLIDLAQHHPLPAPPLDGEGEETP
ncbi:DUF559 domain-containing protein [Lysobacter arvi]|uniref:DUF559 domain-containing protein n=1 Tax=Lysobacter arvi TaxID=3038776 RepID=A0ABU1C8J7_9GAMM|nr:DUF559 domain-containing protein [Lysobacter arvi]MDR0181518.1 DUF559 domain-containing protein [Lysobacter arvi]